MAESEQLPSRPEFGVTLLEVLISMLILSLAVGLSSQFISSATNHHKIRVGYSHLLEFIDQTQHRVLNLSADSPLRIKSVHQNPFPELNKLKEIKDWNLRWEFNNLEQDNALITVNTRENNQIKWKIFLPNIEEVKGD